jgi:hypothetical protein
MRRQLAQFTAISLVGLIGRTSWIAWSYHALGEFFMPYALPFIHILKPEYLPSETASGKLGTYAAMMIGIVVVMFWNFFANRYWTYNDVE